MPNRNPYAVFGTSVTSAEDLSNKSFSATQYLLLVCGGYLGTVVSGGVFGLLFGFIIGLFIGPILAFIAGLVPFTLAALFAPARTSDLWHNRCGHRFTLQFLLDSASRNVDSHCPRLCRWLDWRILCGFHIGFVEPR